MARMAIGVIGGLGFRQRAGVAIAALLALAGCGGGGGGGSPPAPPPPPGTFSIGGTVAGLSPGATGLILRNNGGNDLSINANGNFSFSTRLATGAPYAVTVAARPSAPSQACIVGDGGGTVAMANVTTVDIICGPAPAKFLYVTADSPSSYVRGFTINALTGALAPISTPTTPSGTPGAVVPDPDGQFLYILNLPANNVSVYSIHQTTGVLTETTANGSPFTVSVVGASSITIHPGGAFAYVPHYNYPGPGWALSIFSVHDVTGALSPAPVPAVAFTGMPTVPSIDPDGEFLYIPVSGDLYGFSINASTGALTPVPNSPYTDTRPGWMTFNGTGSRLYVSKASDTFPNNSSILAYNVLASGALDPIVGSTAGSGTAGGPIRLSPDGRFLFVAGTNAVLNNTVTSFAVNQVTGALSAAPNGTVTVGSGGSVVFDVDPSGRAIPAFPVTGMTPTLIAVNQVSGALSGTVLDQFPSPALTAVLDRSGLFAYVLQYGGGTVYPYLIDPIGLRADELPPVSIGGGNSLRQAVLVGTQ